MNVLNEWYTISFKYNLLRSIHISLLKQTQLLFVCASAHSNNFQLHSKNLFDLTVSLKLGVGGFGIKN